LETLRYCFPTSLRRILRELPRSLDETYEHILKNINAATRAHAHRLLQCLTVASRPLRLEELAEVLALDFDEAPGEIPILNVEWRREDQERAVLSTCSSLITVVHDGESRVVQFSHFSVKEFLTSGRLAVSVGDISFHHILLEPAHTILTQSCLGVLLYLDDSTHKTSLQRSPLAEYAAQHWFDHALFENVSSHVNEGMENLFDLDKPHFLRWIRTHDIDDALWRLPPGKTRPSQLEAAPMYYAALCGFRNVVEKLIRKHPEHVSSTGACGTALHAASRSNHLNVVQSLLKHGADANAMNLWGWTPLHLTSRWGYLEIVQCLLANGADVNAKIRHWTPLHLAVMNGHLELVRTFLSHNADVNSRTSDGSTPLHRASESGHVDMARLLLDHGTDPKASREDDQTPLHFATGQGHLEIVRLLLEHGADVNAKQGYYWTPLHLAGANGHIEVVRTLLKHNANISALTIYGNTPLHSASRKGNVHIVRLLLDHGADLEARGDNQSTPLHLASCGHLDVVQLLLVRGADVSTEDNYGNTAYQIARKWEANEVAQLLLKHGAENKT
jgi:ankyrin repeat protein